MPYNIMGFPLPTKVSVDKIVAIACDGNYACSKRGEVYVRQVVDLDEDGFVDIKEAEKYAAVVKYGHADKISTDPKVAGVFGAVRKIFFAGSPLDGKHSTITPLVIPAGNVRFSDGDTFNIIDGDGQTVHRLRFSGIDTPESFVGKPENGRFKFNPKLKAFFDAIWVYWFEKFKIPAGAEDTAKIMIRNRIVYAGLMAGITAKGLKGWMEENGVPFGIMPSFDRLPKSPESCNTLRVLDRNDRLLGLPYAGLMSDGRNYLAEFIKNKLPAIMSSAGSNIYAYYKDGTQPNGKDWETEIGALSEKGKAILAVLSSNAKYKEVWTAISPETLPNPAEMFSQAKCEEMAKLWLKFSISNPSYRNDVQAMLVFLGLGWAYPKYPGPNTKGYMAVESAAMGPLSKKPVNPVKHGLWGDVIFGYMQPNPEYSKLFKLYSDDLARGAELLPQDCCEFLNSQGLDKFDHC